MGADVNQSDVIRMAREAGFDTDLQGFKDGTALAFRLAALVAAHEREVMFSDGWRQCAKGQRTTQFCEATEKVRLEEREECAKVCDELDLDAEPEHCAKAIRARGQE